MSHDEVAEMLGAYALDAVDPDEARAIEEHLRACPQCTAELAAHHEVAGMLGNAGGEAPPHLWDRLAEQVAATRGPEGGAELLDLLRAPGRAPGDATRRRRPPIARNPFTWGAGGLAAAALVVVGVLGWQVHRLDGNVHQLQAVSGQQGMAQAVQAALVNPQARLLSLDTNTPGSTTRLGEIAVLPSGVAYLVNTGLPALSTQQTYQLWGQVGSQLVSLGLLGNNPRDVPFEVSPSVVVSAFDVTAEHAGGVVRTAHVPVAVAEPLST